MRVLRGMYEHTPPWEGAGGMLSNLLPSQQGVNQPSLIVTVDQGSPWHPKIAPIPASDPLKPAE